jgi:ElaA protein
MSSNLADSASIDWKLSTFDALSVHELYELLQLRTEVFAVEQNCAFQDMDGADAQAAHLMGRRGGQLLAYARCFPAGIKFTEASIGRIVTRNQVRGCGLGHLLIEQALEAVAALWGRQPIRIGAQARLKNLYTGHGFVDVGRAYIEDGIAHLEMVWRP